jgi:cobaltochelatase CobS
MAKLKDLYDPEVIAGLTNEYCPNEEANDGELKVDPYSQITAYEPASMDNGVRFSTAFGWKPKSIPDIYVPMFTHSDWEEAAQVMIPDPDPDWIWNRELCEQMALAFMDGDTVLIHGLQGTGKSCALQEFCATLIIPFWRMSCNRETREAHFLGNPNLEYDAEGHMHIKQEPTLLTDSLRYGGLFCEDEAFRHNAALVLQSLREKTSRTLVLANADGRSMEDRVLKAPKGRWWYGLTDNTAGSGDETGVFDAEVQDASSLDRIDTTIEAKYLGKPQERKLLQTKTNLNDDIINGMIDLAKLVRQAFTKGTMMSTMSARGVMSWAAKTERLGHIGRGLQYTFLNKLSTDDRKVVEDMFHQVFARKITDDNESTSD